MANENYELLRIKVKDFGVIKEGEIKLKPLTIFFGKNNTGKTYMGYLIWGLGYESTRYLLNINVDKDFKNKILSKLSKEPMKKDYYDIKDIKIKNMNYRINNKYVNFIFNNPKLKVHIGCGEISLNDVVIYRKDISKFLVAFGIGSLLLIFVDLLLSITKNKNKESVIDKIPEPLDLFIENVLLKNLAIKSKINNTLFIPASKSGLVLVNKYLGKEAISSTFSEDDRESEPLPKPIIEFINSLPTYSNKYSEEINKNFLDVVEFLQNNLINGRLIYNKTLNKVSYRPSNKNISIPLQYSSSLVVESSPLILYLAYSKLVKKGTLLIIEEPEAHLHPDAQRIFARAIVKLINRGVYVLLITHSPYILQQINNCIKLYYLEKTGKNEKLKTFLKEHRYGEDEILNPEKVAPYLFVDEDGGVKIKELEIIEDEGISYEAFYYTLLELHNETEELRDLIEGDDENFEE
jgi:hypothetical protein